MNTQAFVFETERLIVRNLKQLDFPAYFEMQGNPNVHRFTGTQVDEEGIAREGLAKHIAAYSTPGNDWWIWGVELKDTGEMVGTCAIIAGENEKVAAGIEIGYRFLEKHWGNGFAGEICDPLINHAFAVMELPSLFATVDIENVPSLRVLERSPLKFVTEYFNPTDNSTDRVYVLTREEFLAIG